VAFCVGYCAKCVRSIRSAGYVGCEGLEQARESGILCGILCGVRVLDVWLLLMIVCVF